MLRQLVSTAVVAALLTLGAGEALAQRANPCAPKNPCAAKQPCAAQNPCAAQSQLAKMITRPPGTKLFAGKQADLIKEGERLWNDAKLSTNGLACQVCHRGHASFRDSFAKPYPHAVGMVQEKAGLKQIKMDEMAQICLWCLWPLSRSHGTPGSWPR